MNTIIGLYPRDRELDRVKQLLKLVGFNDDDVQTLTKEGEISDLLNSEQTYLIAKNAILVAVSLVAVYLFLSLVTHWWGFTLFDFGKASGIVISFSVLLGAITSVALGILIGEVEYKNDVRLYKQGVRQGDLVIAIKATRREIKKARRILEDEGATGVRRLLEL